MKFNSAFFSSLLALSISQAAMSTGVESVQPKKAERWFEIEVVLFKQLSNKAELKELFPNSINKSNLPNYQQSFDLLGSYLQPSLTRIKQFVPLCGEKDKQHQFLESLQSISVPFPDEMQLIEQVPTFEMPDFTQEVTQESNTSDSNTDTESTEAESTQKLIASRDKKSDEISSQPEVVTFDFELQKEALAKPIFSAKNICIITQKEMESLFDKEQLTNVNLDSFGVDALPSKLNASGVHTSHSPYLIADASLLLKGINQRLRWSKEFKPLLHFGWRQVGITEKKAIPFKLIAGEHIEYKYQQALTDYQAEINEAREIERNLFEQLTLAQNTTMNISQMPNQKRILGEDSLPNIKLANKFTDNTAIISVDNKLKMKIEYKQQILNQLFSRIKFINNDSLDSNTVGNIVNDINEQSFENILSNNEDKILVDDQTINMGNPPKKPLQPWLLDGFIKIHLDHYLYINADFNVFNQKPVATLIEKNKNDDVKLINFSQNRRVITGEIHYFDHPYIGMIVQIRRFDPTKPVGEQVSQAIR